MNQFEFQEAWLLKILRYSQKNRLTIQNFANKVFLNKRKHWYVRVQAANILSNRVIKPSGFNKCIKLYENEKHLEVKRSLIKLICQLDSRKQFDLLLDALYNPYYKISDLAKMLLMLRQTKEYALNEINSMFRNFHENTLLDNFYKIGVIRFNTNKTVLLRLRKKLLLVAPNIESPYLKLKIKAVIKDIDYKQQKIFKE